MGTVDLGQLLSQVPGTRVSADSFGRITVEIVSLHDQVRFTSAEVLDAEEIIAPTGAPAVRLALRRGHAELPLIVTVDDVAFMPAESADLMDGMIPEQVPSAPHMVAYSEMHRDVRALGKAIDDPRLELDPDMVAATLLLHRCFLSGAVAVGLWPIRVAAWWEYMYARVGERLLSPFRPDEDWDRLIADVRKAREAASFPAPSS